MDDKDRTIKVFKDKKHKVEFILGQENDVNYEYVCGPRTNNMWYKVIADYGKEVVAKIPDGFQKVTHVSEHTRVKRDRKPSNR